MSDERQVVVRTQDGRYTWYPLLQIVDYIPRGSRQAERTLALYESTNSHAGAVRASARDLLRRYRTGT